METVPTVNEERIKNKGVLRIYQVCSTCTCFSISSFLAHWNLRMSIQTESYGV